MPATVLPSGLVAGHLWQYRCAHARLEFFNFFNLGVEPPDNEGALVYVVLGLDAQIKLFDLFLFAHTFVPNRLMR